MEIQELKTLIKKYRDNPWDFFKSRTIKEVSIFSHPDKWIVKGVDTSSIFAEFQSLYEKSTTIPIKVGKYTLLSHICTGDLREIYNTEDGAIIKVPRVKNKSADTLIKKEEKILKEFNDGSTYSLYFPTIINSFSSDNGITLVTKNTEKFFSIAQILKIRPNGLGGRHVGWITRRVLTVLGFVHSKGWANCAVTPEHILISPTNHGAALTGWIHGEKFGDKIKAIPVIRKDMYPEFAKNGASPKLDIVMAAKSLLLLASKESTETPKRIINFLKGMQMGSPDVWDLEEEFSELLKDVYGKRRFVELNLEE